MAVWNMQVFLTRDLSGDAEYQKIASGVPNLRAVGHETGRAEASLFVDVEASSRVEAEEIARDAVASVLGTADIERVGGADDRMQDRQVMLWLVGTRRQVRRWEIALSVNVKAHLQQQDPSPAAIWSAQIERHLALVAANNLLRAIENADGRFTGMPGDMAADIRNQRDLQEHWDEQWPSFYNVKDPGPLKRGGKLFAARHQGLSPFSFLNWRTGSGPELGPGLCVADLYAYLTKLEQEVLEVAPELARFDLEPDPSPWVGETHPDDPWWPK